ncbi:Virion core protein [Eptesipox virus]|uniref:Virion core protein n=1 Tax=Eptesipox virus TaxID=1329402 RepID=A0A220T6A4_9POXV|nr:Virion core protein [Eptesipox virus]ASK51244.1 Virion core protein [Eptesipox virus]WAH71002.1 virion core protein [Eptesipox virus]
MIELVNIFLETDNGRVKLKVNEYDLEECEACISTNIVHKAVEKLVYVLSSYFFIEESIFYLAIKNNDIFIFKCDKGTISIINNEYFVFDESLFFTDQYNKITGIEFIVTESMPCKIKPRNNISISATANNHKFYDGLSLH